MAALGAVRDDGDRAIAGSYAVPVHELVEVEQRVAEIRRAPAFLTNASDSLRSNASGGRASASRNARSTCFVDVVARVLLQRAPRRSSPASAPSRCSSGSAPAARSIVRLRRSAGVDQVRLIERLEHRIADAALQEHVEAAPPRGRIVVRLARARCAASSPRTDPDRCTGRSTGRRACDRARRRPPGCCRG